jgi:hypothetical protein
MNRIAPNYIKDIFLMFKELGISIVTLSNGVSTMDSIGILTIGKDGNQDVISINSQTHIHLNWDNLFKIIISEEDVGAGLEPTATLLDVSGNEILKNYFLKKSKEEILETFGKTELILKT